MIWKYRNLPLSVQLFVSFILNATASYLIMLLWDFYSKPHIRPIDKQIFITVTVGLILTVQRNWSKIKGSFEKNKITSM